MTRKEIVERAIRFENPPRMPLKFDIVGINDCWDVWTVDPTGWNWDFEHERADEWGCLWRRTAVSNTGQIVGHPLADLKQLPSYQWPDPADPRRYAGFTEQLAGAEDRFVMFCFGQGIFERLQGLVGLQNALVGFLRHKDEMHALLDRILDHHLAVMRRCVELAGGRMHAAAMADDWGMQDRAFVSPRLFREFFKPRYQRWFDEIKAAGLITWMHSCGRINDVVDELIDCGLQVVNNQQPNTVGIEAFGGRYRGRICFEAIVDTQATLPQGSYDDIRAQARALVEHYAMPAGGFIASDYNDAAAIGVTDDRRLVMFEAFAELGGYPNYREVLERYRAAQGGEAGAGAGARHSFGRATSRREGTREQGD